MPKSKKRAGVKSKGAKKIVGAMRYVWPGNEIQDYDDPFTEVMETINLHLRALHAAGNDVLAHTVILLGHRPNSPLSDLSLETKCDVRLGDAPVVEMPEVNLVGAGEAYKEITAEVGDEQLVEDAPALIAYAETLSPQDKSGAEDGRDSVGEPEPGTDDFGM